MKARIKHTQQIIDVEWDIRGWIWDGPNGKRIFAEEELVFFDIDIDWQSFRAEAAKDILCAMIPKIEVIYGGFRISEIDNIIEYSLSISDKLIKQLKEKEEK